jgi:uncharacterized protein
MSGETDLGRILSTIEVRQREGVFVVVTVPPGNPLPDVAIAALISEVEGTTLVLDVLAAEAADLPYDFESAWLSVVAHTALDAVGVTAAVSTALAVRGIPCNVIAGFHHDHVLVPIGAVEDAIAAVSLIRAQHEAAQADTWGDRSA